MKRAAAPVCAALLLGLLPGRAGADVAPLRVCADPNNLPFSNQRGEGLENALARVFARALGARLEYTWMPQRRGFVRQTLAAGRCDVVMEVPVGYGLAATTRPLFRSTYVFVSRRDRALDIRSFDDPRLRRARIGVQVVGDDYANPPPAQALGRRGLGGQVVGFPVYGDASRPAPGAAILDAVVAGRIDVAIVWGPLAGWYARASETSLAIAPVEPAVDRSGVPFVFDVAMAVRRDDQLSKQRLERVIETHQRDIAAVVRAYGVPVPPPVKRFGNQL